ncbi:MAG: hypothetical protein U5K29_00410 [Acidimicrobiales bacterium]|nr:hypothetical protein [Acidimicrobiales bacterium]
MDLERATLRVDGSGTRPLVIKEATHRPAIERVRHEIDVLRRVQHPGVVSLLDATDSEDQVVVRTRFCGSRTLATVGPLSVARAAGIVAALAATVADLHELGVSHGRISADHILIGGDGRPVLCGFGGATLDADDHACSEDVAAMGVLLQEILAPLDDVAPIPASRLGRRGAWSGYQRRALLNLADQASADHPSARPSARQLAQNIRATVPDATLFEPGGDTGGDSPAEPPEREPSKWLALTGAGTASLVLVLTLVTALILPAEGAGPTPATTTTAPEPVRESTSGRAPPFPEAVPAPSTTAAPSRPPAPLSDQADRASGCSISADGPPTLADGETCPTALALADGVLRVGNDEFHLGLDPAAAAIGDFSCSGGAQAAVLDLESGEVFVFDRWARAGQPATAAVADQVTGGRRLLAEPTPSDCHRLVALDEFGIRHILTESATEDP